MLVGHIDADIVTGGYLPGKGAEGVRIRLGWAQHRRPPPAVGSQIAQGAYAGDLSNSTALAGPRGRFRAKTKDPRDGLDKGRRQAAAEQEHDSHKDAAEGNRR